MLPRVLSLLTLALAVSAAPAHFVWIVPNENGQAASVVFSESPEPDNQALLPKIAQTIADINADGVATVLIDVTPFANVSMSGTMPCAW